MLATGLILLLNKESAEKIWYWFDFEDFDFFLKIHLNWNTLVLLKNCAWFFTNLPCPRKILVARLLNMLQNIGNKFTFRNFTVCFTLGSIFQIYLLLTKQKSLCFGKFMNLFIWYLTNSWKIFKISLKNPGIWFLISAGYCKSRGKIQNCKVRFNTTIIPHRVVSNFKNYCTWCCSALKKSNYTLPTELLTRWCCIMVVFNLALT